MIWNFNDFKINEELDFKSIPTTYYSITISPLFGVDKGDTIFRFKSNSGESYDIYFSLTYESNHLLSDGSKLYDYTNKPLPTIFFSLTKRGLDVNTFDKLTNKNEKFEVMGKVIYLINEYDKINNYKVYSIGEVEEDKYKFYQNYLHNIPQIKKILEGNSDNYNGLKCYYLIK